MRLYKFGGHEAIIGNGVYHIVMAESKEEAVKKANVYQQKLIDEQLTPGYIKLYTIDDCVEHNSDVWQGEWN